MKGNFARAVILVLATNMLFFALNSLTAAAGSGARVAERVRHAFATNELTLTDWRHLDSRRGFDQYTDCLILQLAITQQPRILARAAAPAFHVPDASYRQLCETLQGVVENDPALTTYLRAEYTRYWHGYLPVTVALLQFGDLGAVRLTLKILIYASLVLLLAVAAVRARELLPVVACIVGVGLFFWGLPQFAQSLARAPGDVFMVSGLTVLILLRRRLATFKALVPFCAVYGAGVVYFEFLTGQLPTAAGFLFVLSYLVVRTDNPSAPPRHAAGAALAALAAFALGGALTIVSKQLFALAVMGPASIQSFSTKLAFYAGISTQADAVSPIRARLLRPFESLLRNGWMLTFGWARLHWLLLLSIPLSWLAALGLVLTRRGRVSAADLMAFAVGASSIVFWVMLLPSHTAIHAVFMVRILIVPIALGWGAFLWQLRLWGPWGSGQEWLASRERSTRRPAPNGWASGV